MAAVIGNTLYRPLVCMNICVATGASTPLSFIKMTGVATSFFFAIAMVYLAISSALSLRKNSPSRSPHIFLTISLLTLSLAISFIAAVLVFSTQLSRLTGFSSPRLKAFFVSVYNWAIRDAFQLFHSAGLVAIMSATVSTSR